MNQYPNHIPPTPEVVPVEATPPKARVIINQNAESTRLTYFIMGITIFIFVAQLASEYVLGYDLPAFLGVKDNDLIISGELWRFFTPMLLHGSILHIGFNMYALNIFGPELERMFGSRRFLSLYILGGFAGNILSFAFSKAPSLGSSTAIFGLLGAQGVFIYQNRELLGSRGRNALRSVLYIAAINLFIGLSPGIDNWGHLGGLIGGIAFTWFSGPLFQPQPPVRDPSGTTITIALTDSRDPGDTYRATLWVFVLFTLIAAALIFIKS